MAVMVPMKCKTWMKVCTEFMNNVFRVPNIRSLKLSLIGESITRYVDLLQTGPLWWSVIMASWPRGRDWSVLSVQSGHAEREN